LAIGQCLAVCHSSPPHRRGVVASRELFAFAGHSHPERPRVERPAPAFPHTTEHVELDGRDAGGLPAVGKAKGPRQEGARLRVATLAQPGLSEATRQTDVGPAPPHPYPWISVS